MALGNASSIGDIAVNKTIQAGAIVIWIVGLGIGAEVRRVGGRTWAILCRA